MKSLFIFLVAFLLGVATHWAATYRSPMQKMLEVHDHMQNGGVRYVWRQIYCGEPVFPLSSPIKIKE